MIVIVARRARQNTVIIKPTNTIKLMLTKVYNFGNAKENQDLCFYDYYTSEEESSSS